MAQIGLYLLRIAQQLTVERSQGSDALATNIPYLHPHQDSLLSTHQGRGWIWGAMAHIETGQSIRRVAGLAYNWHCHGE